MEFFDNNLSDELSDELLDELLDELNKIETIILDNNGTIFGGFIPSYNILHNKPNDIDVLISIDNFDELKRELRKKYILKIRYKDIECYTLKDGQNLLSYHLFKLNDEKDFNIFEVIIKVDIIVCDSELLKNKDNYPPFNNDDIGAFCLLNSKFNGITLSPKIVAKYGSNLLLEILDIIKKKESITLKGVEERRIAKKRQKGWTIKFIPYVFNYSYEAFDCNICFDSFNKNQYINDYRYLKITSKYCSCFKYCLRCIEEYLLNMRNNRVETVHICSICKNHNEKLELCERELSNILKYCI